MDKINYTKHQDKRKNNPTMEKRNFLVKEEQEPYTLRYPRDPSLDPQLVWKGKDQQDAEELSVPAVPVYKQEHIHPKAVIADLMRTGGTAQTEQMNLFSDFNGLDADDELEQFQKSTEFYQHENNWANRMILGDSLLVMNSLAEKEGLRGKVQCIYIDPPYGIKFGSNWQVSTRKRDVKDGKAEDAAREPEVIRAFRDTWELGIHSYLAYLRDRFTIARELLNETGSIFVQIGDENVHLVRCVLDEVFGSENFVATIVFRTRSTSTSQYLSVLNDFLLWYASESKLLKYRNLFQPKELDDRFSIAELPDGKAAPAFANRKLIRDFPEGTLYYSSSGLSSTTGGEGSIQPFIFQNKHYMPASGRGWRCSSKGLSNLTIAGRILDYENTIRYKYLYSDFPYVELGNTWNDQLSEQNKEYIVQTTTKVIERCILMTTDPGDLVLDPTCGSGTTAYVAEQWGRRWITIDTSRVALALARTRLMSARFPYYLLADSPEGIKREAELTGTTPPDYRVQSDIKKGFVYRRVPHITLKSIANNPEIEPSHGKWETRLRPLREQISQAVGEKQTLEEWQIPRERPKEWPEETEKLITNYFQLRLERQKEIDAAIQKHAETELLYDKPYEDMTCSSSAAMPLIHTSRKRHANMAA